MLTWPWMSKPHKASRQADKWVSSTWAHRGEENMREVSVDQTQLLAAWPFEKGNFNFLRNVYFQKFVI